MFLCSNCERQFYSLYVHNLNDDLRGRYFVAQAACRVTQPHHFFIFKSLGCAALRSVCVMH
ncbi:hypothetical protein FZI19_01235 [Cronobacter muytjensii]|uniref:Uncharacterized protein n=1 Tax=Cronobacter muytjensii TaxID=413501 RepID=A0A2T7AQ47_9ENTR|nr:hypothetical protein FZI19_01235 [Cronobacter muytjensii]PUX11647.1 hypothetical protein AUN14_15690 [Cronobacter muytjensii]